jgi:pimeloyl-ACP methyl ester carboxylesterase
VARVALNALRGAALYLVLSVMAPTVSASEGVILLHGLARTSQSMERMAAALTAAGYVVANIDYPSRTQPIGTLSESVVGGAMADARLNNCSRIHFVTHSLGGILVRSYFSKHTDPRLGRVVMLGPPNRGSEVVDRLKGWSLFKKVNGPAGSELGTDAQSVPNTLPPVNFELGVIAGDRSINWINSLMIAGPDDGKVSVDRTKVAGMKEHLVLHVTHPFIMKNRTVIEHTLRFLQTGQFN